ncbi:hypothetical protein Tco_0580915 [Tanacetum coccineum]
MASMNTRLNIEKLDGNIVQKHGGYYVTMILHGSKDDVGRTTKLKRRKTRTLVSSVQGFLGRRYNHVYISSDKDHTFEVEPQENVDQGAGLQEVQTQDLMDYQLARDKEQHLACELFGYREDSNEAAFVVAAVEKIYAHESLTFNDTVACEVISKWKARLKDDIDARSDVYVLNKGCKKCSDDSDGYYWESTPGDCDVEKNDVGMLDKFDRGLQTDVQVFVDFDYAMGRYHNVTVYDTRMCQDS